METSQAGFIGNIYIKEERILPETENEDDKTIQVRSIASELNPNLKLPIINSRATNKTKPNNGNFTVNIKAEPVNSQTTNNGLVNQILSSNEFSFENLIKAQFEEANQRTECIACNKTFSTKYLMQTHQRKFHIGKYECKLCHKRFWKKQLLVIHLSDHTENPNSVLQQQLISIANDGSSNEKSENAELKKSFQCDHCKKFFSSKDSLNKHLNRFKNVTLCDCLICDEKFHSETQVKKHLLSHQEGPFQCKDCEGKFEHPFKLLAHQKTHSGTNHGVKPSGSSPTGYQEFIENSILKEVLNSHVGENLEENDANKEKTNSDNGSMQTRPTFECKECGKLFSNEIVLMEHVIAAHSKDKKFVCSECNKMFRTKKYLACHIRTHTKEKLHKCDECNRSFISKYLLKVHKRYHTGDARHKCSLCPKIFFRKIELTNHLNKHNGYRPFKCANCNLGFYNKQSLNSHTQLHTGEKPYRCEICNEAFRLKHSLKLHLNIHSEERLYECKDCNRKFKRSAYLANHQKLHAGVMPHKCNVCKSKYRFKWQLNIHNKLHTGEGLHKCSRCDKSFITNSRLKLHFLMHTGERPYRCGQCEKAFITSTLLKYHMQIHTGEKPLICRIRNDRFSKKISLENHLFSPKKSYECYDCDKLFTYKRNLAAHRRIFHRRKENHEENQIIASYQCEQCNETFSDASIFEDHQRIHILKEKP